MVEEAFRQAIGFGQGWVNYASSSRCASPTSAAQAGYMLHEDDTRVMCGASTNLANHIRIVQLNG